MEFEAINSRALQIREKYNELNFQQRGIRWNATQVMAGLVGDIGDLSKIIMANDGLRAMDDVDSKLAHELSDCLWSLLVIASKCNIDLAAEFMKTMDELEERVNRELAAAA